MNNSLVLLGMPGAGKTTIGKILALEIHAQFIETDQLVTEKANLSINEIFQKYGEEKFRQIETEVIENLQHRKNYVIATGGGTFLSKNNRQILNNNHLTLWIDYPIEALSDRLISSLFKKIAKNYSTRPIILKFAQQGVNQIINDYPHETKIPFLSSYKIKNINSKFDINQLDSKQQFKLMLHFQTQITHFMEKEIKNLYINRKKIFQEAKIRISMKEQPIEKTLQIILSIVHDNWKI